MNKKGRTNWMTIVVIAVILLALFYFGNMYFKGTKTLAEHRQPADISKSEEGTGMDIKFYKKVDGEWEPVEIPSWFRVAKAGGAVVGAIVTHPPAPSCTVDSDCEGYVAGGNIRCWQGGCALANVDGMSMTIGVTNGADFSFTDVHISAASPTALANALPTSNKTLSSGGTVSWDSDIIDFDSAGWIGTQQTLSVTVTGTNSYDGSLQTASDSVILKFDADPTGGFSVVIQSGVPGA